MFEYIFTLTIALFMASSALCIFSLHTDNARYFVRARLLFYVTIPFFLALGAVRFYHATGMGIIRGSSTIWGYFYFSVLLLVLALIYLHLSRWSVQWRSFAALALPFITLLLIVSVPFAGSPRRIDVDLSNGLLPVHIIAAILGELLFFFSFAGSVLYLVMEGQLRKKASMKFLYRLPNIESIEMFNRWAISRSFLLLSFGLVVGVYLALSVFQSPFLGSPKEIILYASWIVLLFLFYLRYSNRLNSRRMNQLNVIVFAVLMCLLIVSNIFVTEGFHSFK